MPPLNTERLNILANVYDHIAEKGRHHYNQATWGETSVEKYIQEKGDQFDLDQFMECGTTCCIAGQAVATFGDQKGYNYYYGLTGKDGSRAIRRYASELLGIDSLSNVSRDLFQSTPFNYSRVTQPEHAAGVLRHLADTGEVKWTYVESH